MWVEDDERDPDGWDVVDAARSVNQRIRVAFDQSLDGYCVSYAQYRMLEMINHTPNIHVGELSRRLRVTRQSAAGVLRKLYMANLVDELDDGGDYWKCYWVTDHGRRWLLRYREAVGDTLHELEKKVAPAERRQLVILLYKADRALTPPRDEWWWLR